MTTLLVASTGGHLKQLSQLYPRLEGIDGTLPLGHLRHAAEPVAAGGGAGRLRALRRWPRSRPTWPRNFGHARRILADGEVDTLVSTGSAVALPFFLTAPGEAAALPLHRERRPQRRALVDRQADRPRPRGAPLQPVPGLGATGAGASAGRSSTPSSESPRGRRWGTDPQGGGHAGHATAASASRCWSNGCWSCCPPTPRCSGRPATPTSPASDRGPRGDPGTGADRGDGAADLVVAHAGVGAALAAFEVGKCPLLVPRRRAREEHIDDHQTQIAAELGERGVAVSAEADALTLDHLIAAAATRVATLRTEPRFITRGVQPSAPMTMPITHRTAR